MYGVFDVVCTFVVFAVFGELSVVVLLYTVYMFGVVDGRGVLCMLIVFDMIGVLCAYGVLIGCDAFTVTNVVDVLGPCDMRCGVCDVSDVIDMRQARSV